MNSKFLLVLECTSLASLCTLSCILPSVSGSSEYSWMKSHLQVWTCRVSRGSTGGRGPGPSLASHGCPGVCDDSLAPEQSVLIHLIDAGVFFKGYCAVSVLFIIDSPKLLLPQNTPPSTLLHWSKLLKQNHVENWREIFLVWNCELSKIWMCIFGK